MIWCNDLAFVSLHAQISEKQKSLYEALERQQHYQESLQSISTKMESIEGALNEGLEPNKTPESQMAAHQVGRRDKLLLCIHEVKSENRHLFIRIQRLCKNTTSV